MYKRNLMAVGATVLAGILLSGCGSALTDQQFSEAALSTCSALRENSAASETLYSGGLSYAYTAAATELNALKTSEETAPNGTLLRSGISGLADSYLQLEVALEDATTQAGISGVYTLMIMDDGTFMAYPGDDIFSIQPLNVDPSIWAAIQANLTQVEDAAQALGLDGCSPIGGA